MVRVGEAVHIPRSLPAVGDAVRVAIRVVMDVAGGDNRVVPCLAHGPTRNLHIVGVAVAVRVRYHRVALVPVFAEVVHPVAVRVEAVVRFRPVRPRPPLPAVGDAVAVRVVGVVAERREPFRNHLGRWR